MIRSIIVAGILARIALGDYTPEALADQITNLPGAERLKLNFNQFSGYLSLPGSNGNSKQIHYWLVESTKNPRTDPVTFWTNGGPGCSGLIGFFTEQGPFRPNADLSLSLNEYAWNSQSNMVFIESPAGVGFSYSNERADLSNGDAGTALDNYNLIQAFLTRFPDFRSNTVYLTSESYGGHYLPTWAKEIVDQNTAGVNAKINFGGFAVGNPYTNVYSGTPAMIDTFWGHQIVPKSLYNKYQEACTASSSSFSCLKYTAQLNQIIGNLNPYALDYPVCLESKFGKAQRQWLLHSLAEGSGMSQDDKKLLGMSSLEEYEPCEDDFTDAYLNQPAVKRAMNVNVSITWASCSNTLKYNHDDSQVSTAPIYQYLIDNGHRLNILVYSGDDDSICATIGTQNWIWDLGYTVASEWETYFYGGQTVGYLTKWKNTKLAFLTVRGAGHEVPTYKPDVALDLFTQYLQGKLTNA